MANEKQEQKLSGKSASEKENIKAHGEEQGVEARTLEPHEFSVGHREVSDEELEAIEERASEPTVALRDEEEYDGKRLYAADVAAGASPSRDSKDYVYRDVLGTTIVGYQEQVPRSEVE